MACSNFWTLYGKCKDAKIVVAGAKVSFYLCVCVCASSGSSEGEPQKEGDGGEDQESQAGEGESRAREAGAPAEEEATDWHEQRYATSPHAVAETETGRQVGSSEDANGRMEMGVSWNVASHIWTLKQEDNV